jgi:hypothetical protein
VGEDVLCPWCPVLHDGDGGGKDTGQGGEVISDN